MFESHCCLLFLIWKVAIFNWSHKIGGNKLLHIHLSISPQLNVILSVFRGLSCGNFSVEWNKIIENCCSTVESLRWSPWDWEEFVPSRPRETDIPNMCLISIFILYSFHSHFFHWTLNQQHQKNYDVYKYAKMIIICFILIPYFKKEIFLNDVSDTVERMLSGKKEIGKIFYLII